MRNFEERKAEVLKRGADGVKKRKDTVRAVTATASACILCFGVLTVFNFGNAESKGKTENLEMDFAEKNEVMSPDVSDELPSEQGPIVPPSTDIPEQEDPTTNIPEQVFPETEKPEWDPPEYEEPKTDENETDKPEPDTPMYTCYVMLSDGKMAAEIYGKDRIDIILRHFDGITGKDDSVLENKPDNLKDYYSVSIVYGGECIAYRLYDGYLLSLTDWNYYMIREEQQSALYTLLGID